MEHAKLKSSLLPYAAGTGRLGRELVLENA